jgi:hypothetical protein
MPATEPINGSNETNLTIAGTRRSSSTRWRTLILYACTKPYVRQQRQSLNDLTHSIGALGQYLIGVPRRGLHDCDRCEKIRL